MGAAYLEAIYIAPSMGQPPQAVGAASAVPGRGLEGDRRQRSGRQNRCRATGSVGTGLPVSSRRFISG
jgi:hypothetical protein